MVNLTYLKYCIYMIEPVIVRPILQYSLANINLEWFETYKRYHLKAASTNITDCSEHKMLFDNSYLLFTHFFWRSVKIQLIHMTFVFKMDFVVD